MKRANTSTAWRFSDLSEAEGRLVRMMQDLNFGKVENLLVRSGQPIFNPLPRVVREIKLGADSSPRPEWHRGDFALKDQIIELIQILRTMDDGVVHLLEVKHGLAFRLLLVQPVD